MDTDARNCISKIVPVDPDDVDETDTETRKIQKTKPDKKKKAPEKQKQNSATENSKTEASVEGGNVSDADTEASVEQKYLPDQWLLTRDVLIRVHNKPRTTLFTPNEDKDDPSPLPLKWLDIMRRTQTSCTGLEHHTVEDYWLNPEVASRDLGEEWIGRTCFYLRRTPAKKGYRWENCRETRRQKNSNRPASIWPEEWPKMGDKVKAKAIVDWNKEFAKRTVEGTNGLHAGKKYRRCLAYFGRGHFQKH